MIAEPVAGDQGRSRSYPESNPFPAQGSITVDTFRGEGSATPTTLPTLRWGPVEDLTRLVRQYFDGYRPSKRECGFPVVLCGEHGAGKTHTVRHVMSQVASGELQSRKEVLPCFQVYVRAESTDFMELYRELMKQVPPAFLRDMALRFLGVVSSELFGEALKSDEARDRAAKLLRDDPDMVRRAFAKQLVGEDEARSKQAQEVRETFGKQENFDSVLSYLLRDDLGPTARAWLVGENISAEDVKKLGVTAPIRTPAVARWALRFLATLFGRGGRPLLIFVDQYEKLVIPPDGRLDAENVGILRSLVDEISKESGMLVLAGNEQAWQTLAAVPDLRQRFGNNVILFPRLTVEQAREIVRLYLTLGRYEVVEAWKWGEPSETLFTLRGHALPVRSIAITPDGRRLVSASKDSSIKVWDLERRVLLYRLLEHRDAVNAVALSGDGRFLASASDDRTVGVYDLEKGTLLQRFKEHDSWVNAVAFSPDGRWLVSGSSDTTIRLWPLPKGAPVRLGEHSDTVWSVAVTPDSRRIISGSSDGTVRVWPLPPTGEHPIVLRGHRSWVNTVAISPNGKWVASASDDHTVRIWSLADECEPRHVLSGHKDAVRGLAWLPDGTLISAGIDEAYVRWDVERGVHLARCPRGSGNVVAFAVRPDSTSPVLFSGVGELRKASTVSTPPKPEELYPFEEEAIRAILAAGRGNLRKLVQDCSETLGRALQERLLITPQFVRETLASKTKGDVDRATVLRRIEKLMAERSLNFRRAFRVEEAVADLAVLGADDQPRMLIHVFEPLFHAEEANKALADVRLASEASHLSASVIFVVAGYASPEVTALLGRAAHDVIVFDGERFDSQFSAVLDKLRRNLARDPARQLKALKTELESVKATLQQLASVRAHETVNVDAQVRRMVEAQSADRVERRRDDVRLAWAKERRTLEAKIEEARKLARKRDFDELEALRSKADLAFWALVRWSAIGTVFAAALAATVSYIALYREVSPDALLRFAILFFLLTFGVGVLTSAVLAANSANVSIRLRMRALAAPVASLEELDRLVFRYGNPPTDVIVQLLSHPNPHIRYAGALHAGVVPIHAVIAAINAEPARILRSVMAHALANAKDLDAIFGEVSARRTPELGYTIEGAAGRGPLPPEQVERFPGPLRALAFIVEWKKFKSSPFGNFPYARLIRDALSTSAPNGPPGPPLTWDPLGYRLPEQVIREAMRDLSPFEEPGIGTLTALECLDLVDECYLYVNQIRYYQESATTAS